MKKLFILLAALAVTGCTTVKTTEVLDEKGNVIKRTSIEEDPFGKLMNEMSGKDIAWWKNGWWIRFEITFTGSETYMPVIAFSAGKANIGHISLTKDSKQKMAEVVHEMQNPLDIKADASGIAVKEK